MTKISFDKFNKDSAKELVSLLNKQNKENVALKCKIDDICAILQKKNVVMWNDFIKRFIKSKN